MKSEVLNKDLRKKIVEMIARAGEGHIPSSFSIVDIINAVYEKHLKIDPKNPKDENRDYFILSKGHGSAGLFVVLEKFGFITQSDLQQYGQFKAILGGHPDRTKVPGAEASTGSLGHGFPFAMGIALGNRIQGRTNKVIALVGDGECHEGTIWETALVAQNLKLSRLCVIVDYNGSSAQILPHPNMTGQWSAFGWYTVEIEGHDEMQIHAALDAFDRGENKDKPMAIIAKTTKGKGVALLEGHGIWHHKIPNPQELEKILLELS